MTGKSFVGHIAAVLEVHGQPAMEVYFGHPRNTMLFLISNKWPDIYGFFKKSQEKGGLPILAHILVDENGYVTGTDSSPPRCWQW